MEPLIIKVTLNTEYHLIIKIVGQTENCGKNIKTLGNCGNIMETLGLTSLISQDVLQNCFMP